MSARAGGGVHVESTGRGPPLVLLHGFAMHGGIFASLLPALTRRFRVHVVDLPGHGRSSALAVDTLSTMVAQIDDATAAIDAPLTAIGWSFGGQVALQWALARPARIRQLVLVCTTPSFVVRDDWTCALDTQALTRFGDELAIDYRLTLQRFLTLQVQGSEAGRRTLAGLRASLFDRGEPSRAALAAALSLLVATDLRASLAAVSAPAIVLAGERDTLVPLAATRALAAALPRAHHVPVIGAGHAPFLSHPDAFVEALDAYVDG